ncbi:MAG: histidine phosphatase family protein [Clostridia bacterium]|nr:histidine phosphatase family protein [Clostridia bacterium]
MTKLILVRHGESEANELGLFAGHLDVNLTERGLKQAELTAEYIVSHYVVDKVYASDLKRAYNTGKAVAEKAGVPIIPRQDLREIGAGDWDGKRFDDLDKLYPKDFEVWYRELPHARCTNGEAVAEVSNRVYRAMVEIAQEND